MRPTVPESLRTTRRVANLAVRPDVAEKLCLSVTPGDIHRARGRASGLVLPVCQTRPALQRTREDQICPHPQSRRGSMGLSAKFGASRLGFWSRLGAVLDNLGARQHRKPFRPKNRGQRRRALQLTLGVTRQDMCCDLTLLRADLPQHRVIRLRLNHNLLCEADTSYRRFGHGLSQ